MSDNELTRHDQILLGLVFSLQAAAMQQLGKIQDPMTGEVQRDLDQAKSTIDVLDMLKVKCRTGTPEDILKMMDSAVMDLQLNYMDEMKKDQRQKNEQSESQSEPDAGPGVEPGVEPDAEPGAEPDVGEGADTEATQPPTAADDDEETKGSAGAKADG